MKPTKTFISGPVGLLAFGLAVLFCWSGSLFADYTLVLNNGGRITVKGYREEGGKVMFYGLGGQIGIPRQQIQSILQTGETESLGVIVAAMEKYRRVAELKKKLLTPEENLAVVGTLTGVGASAKTRRFKVKDKNQQEHQTLEEGLARKIKSGTDRNWQITRGTIDPEPMLLETRTLQRRIDDLNSRLKDVQHSLRIAARSSQRRTARVNGTRVYNLITNSTFAGRRSVIGLRHEGRIGGGKVNTRRVRAGRVGAPLPGYSKTEKELSDLRNRLDRLYQERERVVREVKRSDLFTGSLAYEAFPSTQPRWWRERYGRKP